MHGLPIEETSQPGAGASIIIMKMKRAVTFTGTLYKTTTLMEAFYFGGMAESILSGVTIGGMARLFVTNTWQTLAL